MRLNKVNVLNSKVEYDVTLYSTVGDIFGKIGNSLLRDLDFTDSEYTFNHTFTQSGVTSFFYHSNFFLNQEKPFPYFYPIVHNGYNYYNSSGATLPNLSGNTTGATLEDQTRLYTSTSPINSWSSLAASYIAGAQEYFINSPSQGLRDNQLKPALSIYSLIKLIFKTYGYKISSDFFNTPWMKTLYLYGYFSSELTKFSYKINSIQTLPLDGVELVNTGSSAIVVKKGTGIPCFCLDDINLVVNWLLPSPNSEYGTVKAGTSGYTYTGCCSFDTLSSYDVPIGYQLNYYPLPVGTVHTFVDGDYVDFSLVIDQNIKQIDILSSIAKKFNLVFVTDPEVPNQIIIEPFDYYMGTGEIYDWTPKISFDKGFTVEPALNFIESTLFLTDLEDGDEGNKIFKAQNNRIYGQNNIYNPTDFKSQEKKIDTIFSPELIRKWDDNIGLPLGINYAATNETSSYDNQVRWLYKGVKSKPKLFYWLGANSPFIDQVGEIFNSGGGYYNTYTVKVAASNYTGNSINSYLNIPVISHTMPMGLSDENKINNDSISILFNSELPVNVGVQTFNTYTENDCYNMFYSNRITNLYNPNTRVLTGNFDLKYSDIQNLSPKDIIKINEQYFIVNKINDFNLTNRELTKVELVQFNNNPQTYTDRYFSYYYCDRPEICYKFKTDFTNPNLRDTNFLWSVYYDRQVGSLSGQTSGFTSTFRIFDIDELKVTYTPYSIYEVNETDYTNGSCLDWTNDEIRNYLYESDDNLLYGITTFWKNSGSTKTGINVWNNCADFNYVASNNGIIRGRLPAFKGGQFVLLTDYNSFPSSGGNTSGTTYYSINSGNTFNPLNGSILKNFSIIQSSSDGGYMVSLRGTSPAFISSDYGDSFQIAGFSNTYSSVLDVAISSDGKYIAVCGSFFTTISNDYGVTWSIPASLPGTSYRSIDVSSDGRYWVVASPAGAEPGLYLSTDYGVTFTQISDKLFTSVSISSTGQYILAGNQSAGSDDIWKSSNYGYTFTTYNLPYYVNHVKVSGDGKYQYAATDSPKVYKSSDYGVTFTDITSSLSRLYISAISYDGKFVYSSGGSGATSAVYKSSDYGVSWSNMGLSAPPPSGVNGYWTVCQCV